MAQRSCLALNDHWFHQHPPRGGLKTSVGMPAAQQLAGGNRIVSYENSTENTTILAEVKLDSQNKTRHQKIRRKLRRNGPKPTNDPRHTVIPGLGSHSASPPTPPHPASPQLPGFILRLSGCSLQAMGTVPRLGTRRETSFLG